ncbi:MAG: efflux transporter outer membrane subunit [Steroidobacteraceae bacterium]
MRYLLVIAAAAVLALTSACTTVGPNYAVPKEAKILQPDLQGGFVGASGAPVSRDSVPERWWQLYADPVLDGLIEDAMTANTDLRAAAANLARARAVSAEAQAAGRPQIAAGAVVERSQESAQSYLLTERLPVWNLADARAGVSYQVDLFGKIRRATEAARADAEATEAALDVARVSVVGDVTRAYVSACAAGYELAQAQETVDLQLRSVAVTTRLAAAGRGTAIDVTRGRALVDQSRAAIPVFEARRRAALYKLAVLTGRPPAQFPKALESCADLPHLSQPIPVGDGAALLKRRPDVRQAERSLAAATARIGVATAALYPSVSIGFSAGSTGLLSDIGESVANFWHLGSLISWTFPSGRERARLKQSDAAADAALARFDGVVLNALRETETSLMVYARDLDRNAALRAARDEATEAEQQVQRLYRAGRSPYLSTLDARRTRDASDAALAASDSQIADDQVSLFLVLGGGWSPRVPLTPVQPPTRGAGL